MASRLGREVRGARRKLAGGGALLVLFLAWLLLPGGGRREGQEAPGEGPPRGSGVGGGEPVPGSPPMGLLLDPEGAALAGSVLRVVAGSEPRRLVTNAEGRFLVPLEAVSSGWWSLETIGPGGAYAHWLVRGGSRAPEFRLEGGTTQIAGRLHGEGDLESAGVELLFFSPWGERAPLARTWSDARGGWAFALPRSLATGGLDVRAVGPQGRLLGTWRIQAEGPWDLVLGRSVLRVEIRPADALPGGSRLLVAALAGEQPPEVDARAAGSMELVLVHGWKELLLVDPRGRPLAYERIELQGERAVSLMLPPPTTGLLAGRVVRAGGGPAPGVQFTLEPVRFQGARAELPPVERWNPFLAAALPTVEADAEGAFFLPHGPLERAVLRVQDREAGIARRIELNLPHALTLEIVLGGASQVSLAALEAPEGTGAVWPGRLQWWILDREGRLHDGGWVEAVPCSLIPLEEGEWVVLLCHEQGASALVPLRTRAGEPVDLSARLEPARLVQVLGAGTGARLDWFGPGGLWLGGGALGASGVLAAPSAARRVELRNGAALDLPAGPPPVLQF